MTTALANGFTVTGIDHVVLRVTDLERSLDFYTRVLGCPVERRRDDLGLVQLRAGSSLIDLVPVSGVIGKRGGGAPAPDAPNMDHLCIRIAAFEAEAAREHLRRHGVEVESEGVRYGAGGDGMSFSIRDPEGNGIELRG